MASSSDSELPKNDAAPPVEGDAPEGASAAESAGVLAQDDRAPDDGADDERADDDEPGSNEEDDEVEGQDEPPVALPAKKPAGTRTSSGDRKGAGMGAKRSKPTAGARGAKRRRAEPVEYEPVFSGRLVAATALCLAMVFVPLSPLGRIIAKESPQSQAREAWRVGTEGNVHITVITADFDKLACADEREVDGMHCAFKNDSDVFPLPEGAPYDDNKKTTLQPYRTTDGQLLFMAGLWAQPEVAMRLHNEPARNVTEKKLARFVADCRVKFLAEWQGTKFRWAPRDKWGSGETGMVARPVSCRIFHEDTP